MNALDDGLTLRSAVSFWAERCPEKVAFIDDAGSVSYREMECMVSSLCRALKNHGVESGSHIVCSLAGSVEFAALVFAAMCLNANLIPFDLFLSPADVERRLGITDPAIVFSSKPEHAAVALEKGYRVVYAGNDSTGEPSFTDFLSDGSTSDAGGRACLPPASDAVPVLTIFTSGSTGDPKGVLLSEKALVHANRSLQRALGATAEDVLLTALPMSHIYGVNSGILLPALIGATSVLVSKFNPELVLDQISQHRVTSFNGVPSMFQRMVRAQEQNPREISSLVHASIAGAQCDHLERYRDVLGCETRVLYGLTECPFIATTRPGDSLDTEETGVGRFVEEVEGRVVDESGNPLPVGERGEIVCKSPGAMSGYLNPGDADRACIDEEGWVHTDDIGYVDEHGYIHVAGRKSAVINRGGYKVYPPEIEALYNGNELVADCCVVGFPHLELGQQTILFVELTDSGATSQQLRDFAKGKIAKYKIPDQVLILDQIPQLPNGKHDKKALQRILENDATVFRSDEERRSGRRG